MVWCCRRYGIPTEKMSKEPTLKRRLEVGRLWALGHTQKDIAFRLGVPIPRVSEDIAWVERELRTSMIRMPEYDKALHLQRLDDIYQKSMTAYDLSRNPRVQKKTRVRKGGVGLDTEKLGNPDQVEQTVVTEDQAPGNSRFLRIAQEVTVEHLKFTVGYAPIKAILASEATQAAWRKLIEEEATPDEIRMLERFAARVKAIEMDGKAEPGVRVIDAVSREPGSNGDGASQ